MTTVMTLGNNNIIIITGIIVRRFFKVLKNYNFCKTFDIERICVLILILSRPMSACQTHFFAKYGLKVCYKIHCLITQDYMTSINKSRSLKKKTKKTQTNNKQLIVMTNFIV